MGSWAVSMTSVSRIRVSMGGGRKSELGGAGQRSIADLLAPVPAASAVRRLGRRSVGRAARSGDRPQPKEALLAEHLLPDFFEIDAERDLRQSGQGRHVSLNMKRAMVMRERL